MAAACASSASRRPRSSGAHRPAPSKAVETQRDEVCAPGVPDDKDTCSRAMDRPITHPVPCHWGSSQGRHEGGIGMFKPNRWVGVVVIALALTGCAQKAEQQANETASDRLLAANPVKPPQTGITPQTQYQPEQQQKQETPPAPAPKPVAAKAKPKTAPKVAEIPSEPVARGVTVPAG